MKSERAGQVFRALWVAAGLMGAELLWLRLGSPFLEELPPSVRWRLAADGVCFALAAWLSLLAAARWTPGRKVAVSTLVAASSLFALLLPLSAARSALEKLIAPDSAVGLLCTSSLDPNAGLAAQAVTLLEAALLLHAASLPLFALAFARRRPAPSSTTPPGGGRSPLRHLLWMSGAVYLVTCTVPPPEPPPEEPPPEEPERTPAGCAVDAPVRTYEVSAISLRMTLNRFGDNDPVAFMYVLDSQIPAVRAQEVRPLPERVSIGLRKDAVQPLVLRANLGDCLVLRFTNRLPSGRASLHVHGLPYTAENAGSAVGNNPDTFADVGQTRTYVLPIPSDETAERAYYLHDHGASRQRITHGLFGALIVEPYGSVYRDPETGAVMTASNWEAIIDVPPGKRDFREVALLYHEVGDETFEDVLSASGEQLPTVDRFSGAYRPGARAINYRSEPFLNRMELSEDESQAYGSYMFGDPATPIPRSYLGEPTKMRVVHAGSEVFHIHHLHGGATRWRRNPKAESSDFDAGLQKIPIQVAASIRLDSQSMGPANTFNTEHECGAGGCQQAAGDFLFHCHIQHHYLAGMWGFWRVFDTRQPDLAPLPDMLPPPAAVDSAGLVGRTVEGKVLTPLAQLTDPATQRALEPFIEAQLPPQGARLNDQDATVWDWQRVEGAAGPVYFGEPETSAVWANFRSPTPGVRPKILFNPKNGRYAWPLLRPHLAKRPPFAGNGHTGAPWLGENGSLARPDGLCPDSQVVPDVRRKRRSYPISAIATPLQFTRSLVDLRGLLYVLNEDREAVLSGLKPKEPLVIRANTADCVDVLFTNDIPDEKTLLIDGESKANLHAHFVQFDPQASDGVISGFSYEQSVKPFRAEGRTLDAAVSAGASQFSLARVDGLRPGIWLGIGLGEGMCTPPGGGASRPCTEIRRILSINGRVVTVEPALELPHRAGEFAGVEFVRAAWYADVDTGTVFWHDHISPGGWMHGLFGALIIEPEGSTYRDPRTGAEVRSGTVVDIHAPADASLGVGQKGSFRELFLGMSDEGGGGRAFPAPSVRLDDDESSGPAIGTLNLKAEPFLGRAFPAGYVFSSVRHGDPVTPLPRAYLGDGFVVRALNAGSIGTGLRITGHRFQLERQLPAGPEYDTAPLGISERFDLVLQGGAGGLAKKAGDYLYHSTVGDQFVGGAWGLLRVHDTLQPDLRPLPDRPTPPSGAGFPQQGFTGALPLAAVDPGNPCPAGAPVRRYEARIHRARIVYGPDDEDSNGLAYTLGRNGTLPREVREPLVVRVNKGECLEVVFTNRSAVRAGFHLGELPFDPQGSYGAAVGFNRDSSVAAGAARTYRFWADQPVGLTMFDNLADPASGARGAFGAVVVEPPGSTYVSTLHGGALASGMKAIIRGPSGDFRELVLLINDEDPRIGENIMPYHSEVDDSTGLSYVSDRLSRRDPVNAPSGVFSSTTFGDPRVLFEATSGEAVTLRIGLPWGEQLHSFGLEGHRWPLSPGVPGSERVSVINLFPGVALDGPLEGGAGGGIDTAGDYLLYDTRLSFQEAGLWGLMRVRPGEE